tara:strand:- start:1004 stop:1261 length:258 start_codon:yes stop_codon:yes gene_type:complete
MAKTIIQKGSNPMLEKATGWIRSLTEAGLALIALGVVLQILFGAAVPFLGLDVVGSVTALVKELGAEGLVGLVAVWVLWGIYSKK